MPAIDHPEYGSLLNWSAASVVIIVTLGLKFYARGMLAVSAVLLGIIVGYVYALLVGIISTEAIANSWSNAAAFALSQPFKYGFEFSITAVIGFCLMAFVSTVETVGDVSGITKADARRRTKKPVAQPTPTVSARPLPVSSAACPIRRSARMSA